VALRGNAKPAPVSGGRHSDLLSGRVEVDSSPRHRLQLHDYLEAPLHHPWWVLVPFLVSVTVAAGAAFLLPERYTASCLVLIKASGVPEKIIANVADELDARRYQTIRQEILSRTRLEKVNEELHPYPGAASTSAAVGTLQRAIQVNFKGNDAFSIEFSHGDRQLTRDVTNRLATLFIEEFRRARRAQVEGAADFLDQELRDSRERLDATEEALRRYKERNMGRLPEQLQASLATLQRLQLELQGVEQSLEAAEARLDRLVSRSGASETPSGVPATGPSERETLELELARLRQRYTDEHPEVRALVARLKALGTDSATPAAGTDQNAINATQVERARADVDTLLARRNDLRGQIAAMQGRVDQMPRTEQELGGLTRDFNQLRDNYQTLLRKRMEAQTAERLQQRWTEDFEILDPARLPERHSFPNRPLFVLAGLVLGLGLGLGAAMLAEHFNTLVVTLADLESTTTTPVLGVLPFVDAGGASNRASARPRHPSPPELLGREAAARSTVRREEARTTRRPIIRLLGTIAGLLLVGAGLAFYFETRGGSTPAAPPTVVAPTTLSPEMIAAQQRVRELEERLAALEVQRLAVEAKAVGDAKKKVEAQAKAKGQTVDRAALERVQEDARRQAREDEGRKQREELSRVEEQMRAEEALLAEERRRAAEAAAEQRAAQERAAQERAEELVKVQSSETASSPTASDSPPPSTPDPPPTTAAAEPPSTLVSLSDPGVVPPTLEKKPVLAYPPMALLHRAQGTVELKLLVDERGNVSDAQVVSEPKGYAGLSEAALEHARTWKYRPATRDGVPVKVWTRVQVRFVLPR
jgi:polysaccharide chain length determinant protein (PEP-CTERM system associated)